MKMSTLDQKILKLHILHAKFNKVAYGWTVSAEVNAESIRYYRTELLGLLGEAAIIDSCDEEIADLKKSLALTPEELQARMEKEAAELADREVEWDPDFQDGRYCPSSTAGDYGPGNPWDAPGMSIHDFI